MVIVQKIPPGYPVGLPCYWYFFWAKLFAIWEHRSTATQQQPRQHNKTLVGCNCGASAHDIINHLLLDVVPALVTCETYHTVVGMYAYNTPS